MCIITTETYNAAESVQYYSRSLRNQYVLYLSQISVISLRAVSAPMEKSVPGTLLEMVAGSTT